MSDDDGGSLQAGFSFYYVSDEVAVSVISQRPESDTCHVQVVSQGQDPYAAAGQAGAWLGSAGKQNITGLYLVGHGGPGSVTLGQNLTSANIAPLGGWLYSFLDPSAVVQILGCECAADSTQNISGFTMGQQNPPNAGSNDDGLHNGYNLLFALAKASQRKVEGALNGQSITPLGLKMGCRRVYPTGADEHFLGGGMPDPV
jgi:hypothetical protein